MWGILLTVFIFTATSINAQHPVKGIVADSITKQPLPFATIQVIHEQKAVIGAIDGRFIITLKQQGPIQFSYSGYQVKNIISSTIKESDTILLAPLSPSLEEVVIRSQQDKIKRIINTAIQAKPTNNPDQYRNYQCNIFYKMIVDIKKYGYYNMDSIKRWQDSVRTARVAKRKRKDSTSKDTVKPLTFTTPSHLFMTETYSKRFYKKPGQTQEIIVASKFSGLSKTYFANIITNVLPFHVYSDYILLNDIDFINPIAKGWQGRYRFVLENEITLGADTVFIVSYAPKLGASFNSLQGLVYITSAGYAITHFTGASTNDSARARFVKFEQIYGLVNGKWFPQELNYDFGIRKVPAPYLQIVWNGHSVIDSVLFDQSPSYKFDKAHPLKFSDSVDLHDGRDWNRFRKDSLSLKEANTYKNMDSLAKHAHIETFINLGARLASGRLPIGKLDVDVQRLFASNQYEGTRLGLGVYTNSKVSKYYSVGGWFGYGFIDKAPKYGGSATLFPKGIKENWLSFSFQKNYRLTGQVELHPELSRNVLQNWLLQQVDEVKEYAIAANIKPGYWEISPSLLRLETGPLHYFFEMRGKQLTSFTSHEVSIGFRYAYGEKRMPFFEYYLPSGTKYPIAYVNLSSGSVTSTGYKADYYRALMAITFNKHINRWGADQYWLEAGLIHSINHQPLPRSLLFAGNGYKRSGINFYTPGGFITMRPSAFYSDRYISFFYKHDLDKNFWNVKWSKPYLSIAHNLMYGGLHTSGSIANKGIQTDSNGYHETGLLLNRVLKYNVGFADINLNAGAFYHWEKGASWKKNGVWVVGISTGF